jgi:uncharacterized membrane protein HdeD (DUF308 family)
MLPPLTRARSLLINPLLGVLAILWALWATPLAGLFLLSLLVGAALIFVAPLLQSVLLKHPTFAGQYGKAAAVACLSITAVIGILALAGIFNFA